MIEEAIAKKQQQKKRKSGGLWLEDFIGNAFAEKLREFIIAQAKYNTEFNNAILPNSQLTQGTPKAINTRGSSGYVRLWRVG